MWKVGDRVYYIGVDIYGEIIKTEVRRGVQVYLVRESDYPYAQYWADGLDICTPTWNTNEEDA
jgi:hypothetical protein